MRVVAGAARGRKLFTVDSEETKPTLDRVKEAMFSMLSPYIAGAFVLDLFSGSGALGIEALSRGAAFCTFCDKDRRCCDIIATNLKNTGCHERALIRRGDYTGLLKEMERQGESFDLILLDPPYQKGFEREAMQLLSRAGLSREGAICLCEHAYEDEMPETCGAFYRIKDKKYGTVGVTVYEKRTEKREK